MFRRAPAALLGVPEYGHGAELPPLDIVPVSSPVAASSVSPLGNVPVATWNVCGPVPPVVLPIL